MQKGAASESNSPVSAFALVADNGVVRLAEKAGAVGVRFDIGEPGLHLCEPFGELCGGQFRTPCMQG